jgi:gluconate 2-dehydrogenase gamma chain
MGNQDEGSTGALSRRDLLKHVTVAGAAVSLPVRLFAQGPLPFETLSAGEARTLEAIVARLIPSDENGPGAKEAGAAHYIDRALTGALESSREAYVAGLAALDRYSRSSRGAPFADLSTRDQDSVLIDVETGGATGFTPSAPTFFNMVRTHTIQGTFCDPYYGGNQNFVGWDLLGYPGVRLAVAADLQRLDARTPPNHRSAYDNAMFTKPRNK